jgi:DHA1 family bicyclomycin/chloramphenicol resistance-like MFS transporter
LNHLLLRLTDSKTVFRHALTVQVAVGAVFLVGTLLTGYGLVSSVALLFAFLLCAGITYPNAAALALAPFSKNIGSASALLGFLQLGFGAVAAALVGLLDDDGARPMAFVMALCSLAGWFVLTSSLKSVARAAIASGESQA